MKHIVPTICLLLLGGSTAVAVGEKTAATAGRFAAGPYLLDVTTDAATVAFHLPTAMTATVKLHDDSAGARSFAAEPASKRHFVRITGLEAGKVYRYQVICGDDLTQTPPGDERYQIRTAGRSGDSFTFAVYGDCRPGDTGTQRHHRDVVEQIVAGEPSMCLILGDLVDDGGDRSHWNEFFTVQGPVARRAALYTVLGDNDRAGGRGLYRDYFPKLDRGYYHFERSGVHFFAMQAWDSRGAQPRDQFAADSPQIRWLREELARDEVQRAPFRVVFMHDPVYICRGRSADVMRNVWAPIFAKHRVDLVFSSWHMYERSHHDGVHYVLSGGAGAELVWNKRNTAFPAQAEARRHHFCRVDASAGALTLRAIADDGTVLDRIALPPRSFDPRAEERLRRTARRLRREIILDGGRQSRELPIYLFSYDCGYCRKLLGRLLPNWARQHGVTLRVIYYDLARRGTYDLLMAAGADFARQDAGVPTIFVGRTVLGGQREIEDGLRAQLLAFSRSPRAYLDERIVPFQQIRDTKTMRESAFETLTVLIVLSAGLLDGVNPCAFTTIIFLVSYLAVIGSDRRKILATGGIFTAAVFLTYMAIGVFLFEIASWMMATYSVALIVQVLMLAALLVLSVLSFVDFTRCRRGKPEDMTLQLPALLKDGIRVRIRHFAKQRAAAGVAAFVLGVVIAGMELGCTGQVYLPIVTMIAEPRHRAVAFLYLLLYNIAFILPLAAVFLLAVLGVTSQRMVEFFRRHVAWVKLGLTVLFALMAVAVVHNIGWMQ